MGRITHLEINADDPERASNFYSEVFDWVIQKKWVGAEDYWLIRTGSSSEPGINGGIRKRPESTTTMVPTIAVDSIDTVCAKIVSVGGKILKEKIVLPGTGILAQCADTEGNVFCVLQKESQA